MDLDALPKLSWFPGHMLKAEREIQEKLKLVDAVIELRDARAPLATHNARLGDLLANKCRLIAMTKADLADPAGTKAWKAWFKDQAIPAEATMAHRDRQAIPRLLERLKQVARDDPRCRWGPRLRFRRPLRTMIVGIPNVGKSTLINALLKRRKAEAGPKPGVTRHQQWVKLDDDLELLDTPGIMVPNVEEKVVGLRLGLIASIKQELLNDYHLAAFLVLELRSRQQLMGLCRTYKLPDLPDAFDDLLADVARARGLLVSGGEPDIEQAAGLLVRDFRAGKLGRITLELPPAGPAT